MAWIFSLSAECGPQKEVAEEFARYFDGFTVTLADGSRFTCWSGTTRNDDECWWATICPDGVTRSGIGDEQERRQLTEIGFVLYERLRNAPPFRFALVGVEVEHWRQFSELDDDVVTRDSNGLVLSDSVWRHLGSPKVFVPFAHGYRWRPFLQARY